MTVTQLYNELDRRYPPSLSCEWDSDGLMLCPDGSREVKRVLLTLDVTEAAVKEALNGGYDVIISHHPMIFKPIRCVVSDKIISLIKGNISVMSFHTRLDAVNGGVNDVLAGLIGIDKADRFTEENIGVVGELGCEMSLDDFAAYVKEKLSAPFVEVLNAGKICKRIAVCGGDGKDFVSDAIKAGADTYLTGSMSYNSMTDADGLGLNIITAGHFYTENPVLEAVKKDVLQLISDADCDIFSCNVIEMM